MAINIRELRDKETRELFYPKTHVSAVVGLADQSFFECVIVEGSPTIKVKDEYAGLWANGWMASGGVGSGGGGGGGSAVAWGAKSGYTRPLTVEGVTETLLLDGALSGYATSQALTSGLSSKQDKYDFTIYGATGATYNLANFITGITVTDKSADIGTALTTIATVNGVDIKAKITHQSLAGKQDKYPFTLAGTASEAYNLDDLKHGAELGDTSVQSVSLAPGTDNGTLKLTVDSLQITAAVTGLAALAYKASLSLSELTGADDLKLIEALTGNGLLRRNNNAWSLDSANYITENQTITLTGDLTGSGKTSIATTIGNGKVTNAKLANSTVGVGSATISLGGSATLSQIGVPLWAQANAKPSYAFSELTSHPTTLSEYGITDAALASDLTTLAGRVASIEDWFEVVTVNGQSALHVKQSRALYADSWIASGGVGSGSGGGGTMVVWGTKSGYTRPLTVEGVTETLLLDGALAGYATTAAMNTALAGKQNAYGFTIQGATGATYNLANFLTSHQSLADYALKAGGTDYNFQVDSLIVSDGGTLDGTTYSGKPVLRFSYRYTDESSMIPTIVSETKYLAYKDEIPTDYVKTSGAQQVSGIKTFLANVRGGSSASVNWQITTAGAATFASLTVGGNAVTPANYVTLDGAQTINGAKTFSAQLTASGGIVTGNDIRPSANLGASLGNGNYRFSGLSVNTISSSAYYFRDSAWSAIAHYAGGFDDGIGYMCIYLDADPSNQNPPQNPHYYFFGSGSFQGRGGTKNLGSSGVPWGDVYIANNKAIKSPDTGGTIRDLFKLANNDWLYIGNNGITSVQLNATGYIKMYWDSGDAYASFGAGANAYFPNLLPNGTSGTKNLGSSSVRWNNIYGVNADLSGNLTLSGTTKRIYFGDTYYIELVNIGTTASPLYALHTNAPLYSDGFIAAGGVQQTS